MTTTSIGARSTVEQVITSAYADMATKAKKQLDETGSLTGFSADYTGSTGGKTVTLSISSMAAALYDKSASKDESILAFSYSVTNGIGDRVEMGTGSSLTIKNDQDIDVAAQHFDPFKVWTSKYSVETSTPVADTESTPTPAKPSSAGVGSIAGQKGASALVAALQPPTSTKTNTGSMSPASVAVGNALSPKAAALQQKEDAAIQIVSTLQDFLDGLKNSNGNVSLKLNLQGQDDIQKNLQSLITGLDVKA